MNPLAIDIKNKAAAALLTGLGEFSSPQREDIGADT